MSIHYKVRNLRRIVNMPFIELKPLTILVGRNSAGKSTFLRSFPLLRQSIETKASAPILWWGDYVDFGNFESAANNHETSKTISFDFKISDFEYFSGRYRSGPMLRRNELVHLEYMEVSHGLCQTEGVTEREYIEVGSSLFDDKMRIDFRYPYFFAPDVTIGETNLSKYLDGIKVYFESNNLFDEFSFVKDSDDDDFFRVVNQHQTIAILIANALKTSIKRNLSEERYLTEASKILSFRKFDINTINSLMDCKITAIKNIYIAMQDGKHKLLLKHIDTLCKANHLFEILETASKRLSNLFSQVEYIGPARARSERYYRQQELQVSDISPDGTNLPIFLASLNLWELEQFSSWVMERFGYGVDINKDGAHITINLIQDGQKINVVDTGYGVSQVLPVLAQIWWMRQSRRKIKRSHAVQPILSIEQPELHLHPAHQALLAEAFLDSISNNEDDTHPVTLIVETHSESLINKIGELIADEKIDREQVQILIFGSNGSSSDDVEIATYDSNGMLDNWPHGFFNY